MTRAFATQSPGDHTHALSRDRRALRTPLARRELADRASPNEPLTLQRSPRCACGGGCPRCQTDASFESPHRSSVPPAGSAAQLAAGDQLDQSEGVALGGERGTDETDAQPQGGTLGGDAT